MPKCILPSFRVLVGFLAGMVTCGGWLARAQDPLILFEGKIRNDDGAPLASGQESIVPLETRKPASFVLPFDQTDGLATGVAVASLGPAASIPVVVRDQTGVQLGLDLISIPTRGHTSFVLAERLGFAGNRRGTVEFGVPPGGEISVLGLRFTPTGAFATIPIFAP